MPTATDDLRTAMKGYFNSHLDLSAPLDFLKSEGWAEHNGWLFSPNRVITQKEWDCADFLIQEWDFSYNAAVAAKPNG